jgi:hypothetical protein
VEATQEINEPEAASSVAVSSADPTPSMIPPQTSQTEIVSEATKEEEPGLIFYISDRVSHVPAQAAAESSIARYLSSMDEQRPANPIVVRAVNSCACVLNKPG